MKVSHSCRSKEREMYVVDDKPLPDWMGEAVVYILVRRALVLRSKDNYTQKAKSVRACSCKVPKEVLNKQTTGVPLR